MTHYFEKYLHSNSEIASRFRTSSDILVWSEGLTSHANADNNIRTIKQNGLSAPVIDLTIGQSVVGYRWEIVQSNDGQYFTRFRASNGEIVVRSETYTTKHNAIACANSVRKNASTAPVIDLATESVA